MPRASIPPTGTSCAACLTSSGIDFGFGAPKNPRVGIDFAGTVEAVGKGVTKFKPGDEVFGGGNGALAEYITITEDGNLALKPAGLSFEQAAAVNVAGLTALQTLRDRAGVKPGQKVLINGASGGVGHFRRADREVAGRGGDRRLQHAERRARALARRRPRRRLHARGLHRGGEAYDVVMDNVVNRGVLEVRRTLKPEGKLILIGGGGPDASPWFGAFKAPLKALVRLLVRGPGHGHVHLAPQRRGPGDTGAG